MSLEEIVVTDLPEAALDCPLTRDGCPMTDAYRRLKEENERLRNLARVDALTGYYNYRHLLHALPAEMERTRRTGMETGLIIADLDFFKGVNDRYGHEGGNEVLRFVSRLWMENIRQIDIACRYGGEEFVFILPGTRLSATVGIAERLRRALADTAVRVGAEDVRVTASFGVDSYRVDDHGLSAAALLDRVDRHLLQAKHRGRNRVRFDNARLEAPPTEVTSAERDSLLGPRS